MNNHKDNAAPKTWYVVKLLFESTHEGSPLPQTMDQECLQNSEKLFEESIILVAANCVEEARRVSIEHAKKAEHQYTNTYGQTVTHKFVRHIHSFELNDELVTSGVELYSRFLHVKPDQSVKDVIARYYPEAEQDW